MQTQEYKEFIKLIEQWHKETAIYSTTVAIMKNANRDKILLMNSDNVIGYACLNLDAHLHCSLILLRGLVPKYNWPPIDRYYAGCMAVVRECWKHWALQNKVLFSKGDITGYWKEDKFGNRSKKS